jgi:Na+-translocating ferredoxin:NAD+ oxidoreductase RNF subunit RnfB
MNVILVAVIALGVLGLVLAAVLFLVAKKFAVEEDPRIAEIGEILPQANCGGCGYPGCGGFAEACVKAADGGSLEGMSCPVGGQAMMEKIAGILGMVAEVTEQKVAVVRCNGTCENRPRTAVYDGVKTCRIAHNTAGGETGCFFGCLGWGDCVEACAFDALSINPETGMPEVDESKCTACGKCVKACPRDIIELRPMGKKGRRVVVQCVNKDKGPVAKKACAVACIACGKCVKVCEFDAITMEGNIAYIDAAKCRLCRKCVNVCPQHSIVAMNFPPRKARASESSAELAPAMPSAAEARPKVKESPTPSLPKGEGAHSPFGGVGGGHPLAEQPVVEPVVEPVKTAEA